MNMTGNTTATTVPIELLRKYDRPGPRYTSYPTAPVWSEEIGRESYLTALENASKDAVAPLSVYCHIPFCRSRCYYCGCNTCIVKGDNSVNEYTDRLCREIAWTAGKLKDRKIIRQLHFGGGTPAYVGTQRLARILDAMEQSFIFDDGCEKSIEIDPRITTLEQLEFLADRGFNRISLGVQDFNLDVQQAIGRIQPQDQVSTILEQCRRLGFKGINFDLIYGLPRQTVESFTETLERVMELRPDRLAVYSFAYLPTFKAHQAKINEEELPVTEVKYELFAKAIEMFTGAGYRQIGMDHFALPDDELSLAQADGRLYRNFMGYSVQAAPEMIGLGMSSIGYVDDGFYQNISKLNEYGRRIDETNCAVYRGMKLSPDDLIRQHLITQLMCNFYLNIPVLEKRFDISYDEYFAREKKELKGFIDDKLLEVSDKHLEVTPIGRAFVRNIAMTFDAYLKGNAPGQKATYSRTI